MDTNPSQRAVITGANRGLGLEFTRQLLARGARVVATCRRPASAEALAALAKAHPGQLQVLALSVDDEDSRQAFARALAGMHDGLELLVNNAGVLERGERFGALRAEVLERTFATNVSGPLLLAQALAPLLARGRRPRVLNIGSKLGSIASTTRFNTPSYNISKAALNMAGVLMAQAMNPIGIGVITASPGWVRTAMGGDGAELAADESVRSLLTLVDDFPGLPAGVFLDRNGEVIPW
jgi:NAD(P)-dependent dehydrogenase (short-subunit alcohol dehydrogenase family)